MPSASHQQGDLLWISSKPSEFWGNVKLTFGKTLNSIKTSLFCDTDILIALRRSEIACPQSNLATETNKICAIENCLKEMISSGNGQVYEADIQGKTCAEVLGLAGHNRYCSVPLKISSPAILTKGSLLLASLLQSTHDRDVDQEILSSDRFLKLVLYILQNSQPGANLVVILPRYPYPCIPQSLFGIAF